MNKISNYIGEGNKAIEEAGPTITVGVFYGVLLSGLVVVGMRIIDSEPVCCAYPLQYPLMALAVAVVSTCFVHTLIGRILLRLKAKHSKRMSEKHLSKFSSDNSP